MAQFLSVFHLDNKDFYILDYVIRRQSLIQTVIEILGKTTKKLR